jgi:hypothetical protein
MPDTQTAPTCRCRRAMRWLRLVGARSAAWWCDLCDGPSGHGLKVAEGNA